MDQNVIKSKIEGMNLLDEEVEQIENDIQANKLESLKIGEYYDNCLDFYIDLYKLRIRLGYSINNAAKYLGTNYGVIYSRLRTLNWENKRIKIDKDMITEELNKIHLTEKEVKLIKMTIKKHKLQNLHRKGSRIYSDAFDLYKDIYKMRYKLNYPVIKMANYLFGESTIDNMQQKLSRIGWAYSAEEAQQLASEHSRDYKQIRITTKRTFLANYAEMKGSNLEKYIREKFNIELTSCLPGMEVVVGVNNISILEGDEIDIPIIIIDNNEIYKVGVEVSGDYWHENEHRSLKDIEKKEKALKKKYAIFTIWIGANSKKQREVYGDIDCQIQDIINKIKKMMLKDKNFHISNVNDNSY